MRGGVDDLHRGRVILPVDVAPVVVEEVVAQRHAAGGAQVVAGAFNGKDLAGGEDIVVAVYFSHIVGRNVELDLGAVTRGQVEVGVPGDGDGFFLAADVLATTVASTASAVRRDGEEQLGLREPVPAKVAAVDDAGNLFAAGNLLDGDVIGLGP